MATNALAALPLHFVDGPVSVDAHHDMLIVTLASGGDTQRFILTGNTGLLLAESIRRAQSNIMATRTNVVAFPKSKRKLGKKGAR